MPKRNCKFSDELQKDYPFLKKVCGEVDRVKCTLCRSEFSISHGGRSDIKDHLKCGKHQASVNAAASSSSITSFYKKANSSADYEIAAKEAAFAFHTAVHDISFKTSDCTSKLISKFFEKKFGAARTKTEAIILNVIAPLSLDNLHKDLDSSSFVCISSDTSNRKEIKLAPVVVRYFLPLNGIEVKLLDFQSVAGETSEILTKHLVATLKKT